MDRGRTWDTNSGKTAVTGTNWTFGLARFFGWDSNDPTNTRRIPNAPEECSWIGTPEEGNDGPCAYPFRAVYDVPSMVFRFAMDRWGDEYPGGERALMHRLMRSPTRGLASLADVSDWRAEQILADFYMSAVDRPERLGRLRHDDLGSRRHLEPLRAEPTSSALRIDIRGVHSPVECPSRIHVIPGVESKRFAGADVHPGNVPERRFHSGPHIGMGVQGPMRTASRCES